MKLIRLLSRPRLQLGLKLVVVQVPGVYAAQARLRQGERLRGSQGFCSLRTPVQVQAQLK